VGLPLRAQDRGKVIEEVTVTGSRIARPDVESTVPIVMVTPDEIAGTGSTSLGDLLNELPALRSTFSQSNSSRFLGTTGLNLLDLRGLGTQRTLVLVNGRRHVGSDILSNAVTPDVNTIPSDLIEGIDVVTGGKSAVYGSDAIAGVVNFRLLKNFEGLKFRGQAGQSSRADGDDYFGSALYGTNFWEDKGNAIFNLEFANQKAFFASDRDNLKREGGFVVVDTDPAGAPNGSDGVPDRRFFSDIRRATIANGGNILFTPAAGLSPCGTDANGAAFRCSYIFQPDGSLVKQTGTRIGLAPNGNFAGGNGSNNRERNALAIFPDLKRVNLNVLSNISISDAFSPFLEAKYVRTDSLRFGQPAFFQGSTIGGGVDLRERPRFDNPFLSDANRAQINAARAESGLSAATADTQFSLQRNLLDLGPRQEDAKRETMRFVLGFNGQFANVWNYEVAANYGKFKEDTKVLGNLNQQRFLLAMDSTRDANGNIVCRSQIDPTAAVGYGQLLDDPTLADARLAGDVAACIPLNPFGDGSITPEMRRYLAQNTTSVAEIEQQVYGANVSGDTSNWFSLPAGPIGLAFGVERRTEKNFFKADDLVSSGLTFYNALPLFDPPRFSVNEVFSEVRVPVLKGLTGAKELTLSGAVRYADYNGPTGTAVAYDGGLDYAPIESLRFRAGLARAVRAPNLADRFSAQSQNFATVVDPCSARNIGTGSANRAANCAAAGVPSSYDFVYTATLGILSGGNPQLKEETSDSVTLGFVFQPTFLQGFAFTADYYEITIDDVITSPEAQSILDACYDAASLSNQFCSLFQRAGAGGAATGEQAFQILEGSLQQTSLNYAKSKARGIDFQVAYNRNDVPYIGNLGARLLYTRALQRDDFLDPANPNIPDRVLLELGDPKDTFNLNLDVARGPLSVGYQMRFIGKQLLMFNEDVNSVGGNAPQNADFADRRSYPSVFYHDLRAGYDINTTWSAYLGVDNLTDKEPPLGLAPNTGGVAGQGGSGIYDFRGRFFFGGLKATF
jgi:outer membrane receptor protein involved in Fe transport